MDNEVHPHHHRYKQLAVVSSVLIVGFAVFLFGWLYFFDADNVENRGPIACTAEAKLCPDGSAVGRTGPNCEFTECPLGNVVTFEELQEVGLGGIINGLKVAELRAASSELPIGPFNYWVTFEGQVKITVGSAEVSDFRGSIVIETLETSVLPQVESGKSSTMYPIALKGYGELSSYSSGEHPYSYFQLRAKELVGTKMIVYDYTIGNRSATDIPHAAKPEVTFLRFIDDIDTSNWQTYTNEEFGFEFKYPGEWEVKNLQVYEGIDLIQPDQPDFSGGQIRMMFMDAPPPPYQVQKVECSYGSTVQECSILRNSGGVLYSRDITIGGPDPNSKHRTLRFYLIVSNENESSLHVSMNIADYSGKPLPQSKENTAIVDSIVDSILLQNTDTSNWKTYTNEEFGFEFKYPNSWEIKDLQSYGGWDDSVFFIESIDGLYIHILLIEKTSLQEYISVETQRIRDYEEFIKSSEGAGVHQLLGDKPIEDIFAGHKSASQENLVALGFAGSIIAFPVEGFLIQINKYESTNEGMMFSSIPDAVLSTFKFIEPIDTSNLSSPAETTDASGLDLAELLERSGDADGDGVVNLLDNCPDDFNPDQADLDRSGVGDVCEG